MSDQDDYFDVDFGEPNPVVVPEVYTEAELLEAKAEAWDEGRIHGTLRPNGRHGYARFGFIVDENPYRRRNE
jgi:hypothetical protein